MENRKIIVYSTRGGQKRTFDTDVETWGDLKNLISESDLNFEFDRLQAAESVNKTTLEHPEAKLPEGDFVLMLKPKDTKAGSDLSFKELKALAKSDAGFRAHVEQLAGKNYTHCSTQNFKDAYAEYFGRTEEKENDEDASKALPQEELSQKEVTDAELVGNNISMEEYIVQQVQQLDMTINNLKEAVAHVFNTPNKGGEEARLKYEEAKLKAEEEARLKAEREENDRLASLADDFFDQI
jgi:hypothetical protein